MHNLVLFINVSFAVCFQAYINVHFTNFLKFGSSDYSTIFVCYLLVSFQNLFDIYTGIVQGFGSGDCEIVNNYKCDFFFNFII